MKTKRKGLTLVEVIIASAILAAVIVMAMTVLHSTSHTAASGQVMSQLEQRGNRVLNFCREQMSTASFTHPTYTNLGMVPGSANTAIAYQVCGPAVAGATGAVTLQFGYPDPSAPGTFGATLACFVRFEADSILKESSGAGSAAPAANWTNPLLPAFPALGPDRVVVANVDVNGNGNQGDTFVVGRLMKYVVNEATGVVVGRERLDDNVILMVAGGPGAFNGDMDGDGTADLLFCFTDATGKPDVTLTGATASGLQVNVWHAAPDDTGKLYIVRNNKLLIHLRSERKNG